jgi:hypothetical protein
MIEPHFTDRREAEIAIVFQGCLGERQTRPPCLNRVLLLHATVRCQPVCSFLETERMVQSQSVLSSASSAEEALR